MANPKGNPGNKGGGRSSAYQEKQNAEFLSVLFEEGISKIELKDALQQDKVPGKFVIAAKFYGGDMRVIAEVLRKMLPDKVQHTGDAITAVIVKRGRD